MKLPLLLMGLLCLGLSWWSATMNAKAAGWPGARGLVLRSELRLGLESDSGDALRIEYEYQVAGQAYRGATVSYAGMPAARSDKQALADRYPVGREVTVYYDPGQPDRAVLERAPSRAWMAFAALGAVLVGVGLFTGP